MKNNRFSRPTAIHFPGEKISDMAGVWTHDLQITSDAFTNWATVAGRMIKVNKKNSSYTIKVGFEVKSDYIQIGWHLSTIRFGQFSLNGQSPEKKSKILDCRPFRASDLSFHYQYSTVF